MLFSLVGATGLMNGAPSCEERIVKEWFTNRAVCWVAQGDQVTVFSPRSDRHAEHLALVAEQTLETIHALLRQTQEPVGGLRLIAWPDPELPALSAVPQRLNGASLFLVAGEDGNHIRSAISDIVVDRAAFPHQERVPLWLRIGLRHWVRGGEQSALLQPARKIATDPLYAYDRYLSLHALDSWPAIEAYQQLYVSQSLAMLAWLLQDWPADSLSNLFAGLSEGRSFETALANAYELDQRTLVDDFHRQAERITQLSWPYTEPPPWSDWFTTARVIAIAFVVIVLLLVGRCWWWLRRPADIPNRRAGIELRRYLPRAGSFRF